MAPKPPTPIPTTLVTAIAVSGTNMTDLGVLVPGGFSYALAINANGYVVGGSGPFDSCCPAPGQSHGFVWSPITGTMSDLGVSTRDYAGGIWSIASAINDAGTIGGFGRNNYWSYNESAYSANITTPAFVTYDPEFETTGLNASNVAVGTTPTYIGPLQRAYTFDLGTLTLADLGTLPGDVAAGANGINDLGMVVGFSTASGGCSRAVTWSAGAHAISAVPLPPGALCSVGYGINASGIVVGGYTTSAGEHGFAFDPGVGTPVDLGTLGGTESRAYGVNGHGHIVGWSNTAAGARHAFVYNIGTSAMTDLGVLPANATSEAKSINDADKAVGRSEGGTAGLHAVLWTITFAETSQAVTFTSTPASPSYTGGTYTVTATGGASGNAVTFSSLTASTCTVSGSVVSLIAAGTCTVAADQAGGPGYDAAPQQTQSFSISSPPPLVIPSRTPQVSAGGSHSCALKNSGGVVCWSTPTDPANDFGATVVPAGLSGVVQVSAGGRHSCVLESDGSVLCWGYNAYGEITPPAGLSAVQVRTGDNHTCALKSDGTVVCWGHNGFGQSTVPASLTGVTQISAGAKHTCALKSDGSTIVCWGSNVSGQSTSPGGLSGVTQISAGYYHNCALKNDGTVSCWGNNDYGQLAIPVGLSGVTSISAGGFFTCALKSDGSVVCWGYNAYGQTNVPSGLNLTNAAQSITFTSTPASPSYTGGTYAVSATGGASGNAVTFSSLTASTCTVSGSAVSLIAAETCTVAADQAGGPGYDAAPQQTQSFSISSRPQSITFTSTPPNPALAGGTYTVSATGGASGNAVTFSSLTASACTVSGGSVALIAVGTCTVAANQAAGPGYDAASQQTQTFSISSSAQVVTFTSTPPNLALTGGIYAVSAAGGASGNAVTFSSLTATVCTVTGATVSLVAVGNCTVAGNQLAGNGYTAATQATQTFAVSSSAQAITFTSSAPTPGIVGTSYTISATGGASGNPVTFSSLTSTTCSISGSAVSFLQIGTCTIAANQSAGGGYTAAIQVSQSITVMATQTIVFTSAPPNPALAGNSYTVSVTSGGSGKPVVFSSKTPAICSISGRTVKLLAGGSCEVAANQAGGSGYLPAPEVLQTFNIYIGQVIKFTSNFPTHALVGSTYLVTATGGASGNPVTFTSLTSGICSVTGTAAKFLASGTCTIAANQNGNSTYAQAAQVTQGGKVR